MDLMLTQHKYSLDIPSRAGMSTCKSVNTPVSTSKNGLLPSEPFSDSTRFRKIIGVSYLLDLTYVMLSIRYVSLCMPLLRVTGLLSNVYYDT